jgi:hypothetical protein
MGRRRNEVLLGEPNGEHGQMFILGASASFISDDSILMVAR